MKRFIKRKICGCILRDSRVTIISNNCIGGVLYHNYGIPFNSPFVNVNISMEHFLLICKQLREFMEAPLQEVFVDKAIQTYFTKKLRGGGITFPVGKITIPSGESVLIFFQHYKTYPECAAAWERRKRRMDYSNLFFVIAARLEDDLDECIKFDLLTEWEPKQKLLLSTDSLFEGGELYTRCMNVPYGRHFLQEKGRGICYYECFPYFRWFTKKL